MIYNRYSCSIYRISVLALVQLITNKSDLCIILLIIPYVSKIIGFIRGNRIKMSDCSSYSDLHKPTKRSLTKRLSTKPIEYLHLALTDVS